MRNFNPAYNDDDFEEIEVDVCPDNMFEVKLRGSIGEPKVLILWKRGKNEEQRAISFHVPEEFAEEIFEHIVLSYGGDFEEEHN